MDGIISKIAQYLLGIDDTETSNQEFFIKDLSTTQKHQIIKVDPRHIITFAETLLQKHDLQELCVLNNRQVILKSQDSDEKSVFKYYDFFESIKWNLNEKILLMKDNPWISIFEKENFVFVAKKEIKLNEIEINAIAHDVLNNRLLFCGEAVEEMETVKNKIDEMDFIFKKSQYNK